MATPVLTRFELRGADGGPLRGEVRRAEGGPRPTVVICHGFKGFKDWGFFPHLADRLARSGLAAVSFNFSGSGVGPDGQTFDEPERFGHATIGRDLADLETVITALEAGTLAGAPAPSSLGLFGHSRGGGVALVYARRSSAIRALVTWAAIGTTHRWGPETAAHVDLEAAASEVACPWLQVHGAVDESVPLQEARDLWERSGRKSRLLVLPRGSHTFGARHPWAGTTPELDRAFDETVGWFAAHLFT